MYRYSYSSFPNEYEHAWPIQAESLLASISHAYSFLKKLSATSECDAKTIIFFDGLNKAELWNEPNSPAHENNRTKDIAVKDLAIYIERPRCKKR
ncbi:hypothetical protein DFR28_1109 [Arenicella xantha]|uniref:Uncharacterized protein n=2 Tax=Arenicella xantha TaxID=644221 RepID=A0A395JFJ4_9GAMM|nr:hypothetical protein DFR28_1109 [Arenicella xantha]